MKRQHYVPQFLLRKFTGTDGNLSVFKRGEGLSFSANPEDVAVQRYYYAKELENGGIDTQTIEKQLSEIENSGSIVLNSLLSGKSPTPEQRNQFALFLTYQDFRSPRRRQQYADMLLGNEHHKFPDSTVRSVDNYIKEVTKASDEEREFKFEETSAESALEINGDGGITIRLIDTIHALSTAEKFAALVSKMDWQLFSTPKSNGYIICDSPVQLYENPETLEKYSGPGYWRDGSYVTIPLSPEACLVASHPTTGAIKWPPRFTIKEAKGSEVRFFNDLQLRGCSDQIYANSDFSWLNKKSAELPETSSQLSFMPLDVEGVPISTKIRRH